MLRVLKSIVLTGIAGMALFVAPAASVAAADKDDYWDRYWDTHWQTYRDRHHRYYYVAPNGYNPYYGAYPSSFYEGYPNHFYNWAPRYHPGRPGTRLY